MPPDETTVAAAVISNSPTTSRELGAPRSASEAASTSPAAPVTVPSVVVSAVTRWRGGARRCAQVVSGWTVSDGDGAGRAGPMPLGSNVFTIANAARSR